MSLLNKKRTSFSTENVDFEQDVEKNVPMLINASTLQQHQTTLLFRKATL